MNMAVMISGTVIDGACIDPIDPDGLAQFEYIHWRGL